MVQAHEILRTPEERFEHLPDYPFESHYVFVVQSLRMHFCAQIAQIGQACAYLPKMGKAEELVALLQKHSILFGIHQNHHKQEVDQ